MKLKCQCTLKPNSKEEGLLFNVLIAIAWKVVTGGRLAIRWEKEFEKVWLEVGGD